jgi:hypothetical protein
MRLVLLIELSVIVPAGVGILIALMSVVRPRKCPSWIIRMFVWPVSMPIPVSSPGPKSSFKCISNPPNIGLTAPLVKLTKALVLVRLSAVTDLYA